MTGALLRAEGVAVRHDGATTAAPGDVTLTVQPGEVVLLLGPSGCGKSTFALATNGLVPQHVPAAVRSESAVSPSARPTVSTTSRADTQGARADGTIAPVTRQEARYPALSSSAPDGSATHRYLSSQRR